MTVSPANCPALVIFVKEISAASHAPNPWLTAMAPKPKLTEKYPIPTGRPRLTPARYSDPLMFLYLNNSS